MAKQTKLTKSARGKECQIRVPNVCSGDHDTVVLCHLNGGGMGAKHDDIHGAYGCAECHKWIDGGYAKHHNKEYRDLLHLEGVIRTQIIMLAEGLITHG